MRKPQHPPADVHIQKDLLAAIDDLREARARHETRGDIIDALLRRQLLPTDEQTRNGMPGDIT